MNILEAAEHWKNLADSQRTAAKTWANRYGCTRAYFSRADLYEKTAKALYLESETGYPHCVCHLLPSSECPFMQINGKVLIRD